MSDYTNKINGVEETNLPTEEFQIINVEEMREIENEH